MTRLSLAILLLLVVACAPGVPLAVAPDPGREAASWPPADQALRAASAAMGELKTLREQLSTRTYRNEALFLAIDGERAYVAPDRRYERLDGRSSVESVVGETVHLGPRFFKRVGEGSWQELPWNESFRWPADEYDFPNVRGVSYAGAGEVDGRPARTLLLQHEGTLERRNAGWQFQTRLWIDPQTGYFLRRETRGTREDPDPIGGRPLVQRYEGTWTYQHHDAAITISEPSGAGDAP